MPVRHHERVELRWLRVCPVNKPGEPEGHCYAPPSASHTANVRVTNKQTKNRPTRRAIRWRLEEKKRKKEGGFREGDGGCTKDGRALKHIQKKHHDCQPKMKSRRGVNSNSFQCESARIDWNEWYPPQLPWSGLFERVQGLEGVHHGPLLVEEVREHPEFVPKYPDKKKKKPADDNREDDHDQCGARDVPQDKLQDVWPDGEAGDQEEEYDQATGHPIGHGLVVLADPHIIPILVLWQPLSFGGHFGNRRPGARDLALPCPLNRPPIIHGVTDQRPNERTNERTMKQERRIKIFKRN